MLVIHLISTRTGSGCVSDVFITIGLGNPQSEELQIAGILAIAAAKLKKGIRATAVDNDPDALENAAENIELNNVSDSVELSGEPVFKFEGKYDLVIANIISSVLYFLSDDLKRLTSKWLILSGVLKTEDPVFMERMGLQDFELIEKTSENEWSGYLLKRRDK